MVNHKSLGTMKIIFCKWDVCFIQVNLRGNAFTNDQVALSSALVYCGMQVIPKYLCLNSGLASNLGRNFTTLGGSLIAKYRKQGRAGREASASYSVNTLVRKAAIWLSIKRIELYLGIELKIVIKRLVQFWAFLCQTVLCSWDRCLSSSECGVV